MSRRRIRKRRPWVDGQRGLYTYFIERLIAPEWLCFYRTSDMGLIAFHVGPMTEDYFQEVLDPGFETYCRQQDKQCTSEYVKRLEGALFYVDHLVPYKASWDWTNKGKYANRSKDTQYGELHCLKDSTKVFCSGCGEDALWSHKGATISGDGMHLEPKKILTNPFEDPVIDLAINTLLFCQCCGASAFVGEHIV